MIDERHKKIKKTKDKKNVKTKNWSMRHVNNSDLVDFIKQNSFYLHFSIKMCTNTGVPLNKLVLWREHTW